MAEEKASVVMENVRAELEKREAFVLEVNQPAKRAKSVQNITSSYYQELVRDIDVPSFDTFPKLKTFMLSPLPVKPPTMEENLSDLS